jgi:plastocyanin
MRNVVAIGFFICLQLAAVSSIFGATVAVTVGPGLTFTPATVTIAPGDTVSWNWAGGFHTTTSDASTGAEVWDSGFMAAGSFSHTFTTAGNWPYYCAVHSVPGGTFMNGVVHVVSATPTLVSVVPAAGPPAGGTPVTLTGTNFGAGCTVTFGLTSATGVSIATSTTINATTPAHAAGAVSVSVACPSGTATLPNAFTFASFPSITAVQPPSGPAGATVTISGAGFQNGATVTFGTTPAPVTFVDAATLRAVVPAVATGPVTITVTNPDTQSAAFTGFAVVTAAIPMLSSGMMLLLSAALVVAAAIALRGRTT